MPTRTRRISGLSLALGALLFTGPLDGPRSVSIVAPTVTIEEFTADSTAFDVNATLILGRTEAVLVDAQLLAADATRIADRIAASGRHLKAILLTHSDEDHCYGVATIVQRFPGTPVYMSPAGIEEFTGREVPQYMTAKARGAPRLPDSLIVPAPFPSAPLTVDGAEIEVIPDQQGDVLRASNSIIWIPSIRTVIAGDIVFNGVHVWLAASSEASRAAWRQSLARITALHPARVVAGHKRTAALPDTPEAVQATAKYLVDFDAARTAATTADGLIAAMDRKYGQLAVHQLLEFSARRAYATGGMPQDAGENARVRGIIAEGNRAWGAARVALDRATFERMLLPDAYVQMWDRRISRQEFIDQISSLPPGVRLTRFDATVLTVFHEPEQWTAVIQEKMEMERSGQDGKPEKMYALWITRDAWKPVGDRWMIASSTALGSENWRDTPPIPGW